MPKYFNDQTAILRDDLYKEVFDKKGVKHLRIRRTSDFSNFQNLELEIMAEHIWSYGDSLFKLSNKYYGSYNFWWTISIVNAKPTDAHFKVGDITYIVKRPEEIRGLMR